MSSMQQFIIKVAEKKWGISEMKLEWMKFDNYIKHQLLKPFYFEDIDKLLSSLNLVLENLKIYH